MKLIQLLGIIEEFDDELIVKDLWESRFGFCWDNSVRFTRQGEEKFKKILQSEVKINEGVIILQDKTIEEDDYDLFMLTVAGYVSCTDYDKWLEEIKKND